MVRREHRRFNVIVFWIIAVAACSRSDRTQLDSTVASVAKTAGAAEQSAGLVTQYPPPADTATRPNVLVQVDTDRTDDRFPVAVADAPSLRDVALSVRCKPISGRVDQACGLVFRYRDENNYLVTRANALEDNVRLYYVKNGRRREIASWRGRVTRGEWHTLGVRSLGDQLEVSWDGRPVISKRDETFMEAGRVGLWLKADSYTEYDDLTASPLAASGGVR